VKLARLRLNDAKPSKAYYTVIEELLQGPLPEREKEDERLVTEAGVLVNAAAETTTWSKFPAALIPVFGASNLLI
jgi:hypothetical protein